MVAMMNLGHGPVAQWGFRFLNAAPDAKVLDCGCGGEYEKAVEKIPAGHRQGNRLFACQRGEIKKRQQNGDCGGPLRRSARKHGGYDLYRRLL